MFGRPWLQVAEVIELDVHFLLNIGCSKCQGSALACHTHTVLVEQFNLDSLLALLMLGVVESQLYVHRTRSVDVVEVRCDVMVAYECLRSSHEIHVAMNACEVPHVLALKI